MTRTTTNRIITTDYGYIQEQTTKNSLAVPLYILFDNDNNFIESSIFFNELQVKLNSLSNIYLDRLRQQYKLSLEKQTIDSWSTNKMCYDAMRLFCLDTQLVSFNDIEVMESSFS